MNRRTFCSALLLPTPATPAWIETTAQELADIEFDSLAYRPRVGDWIGEAHLCRGVTAVYCTTERQLLVELFARRVEHMIERYGFTEFDIGRAGETLDGYSTVTLIAVDSLEYSRCRHVLLDLLAKYPLPSEVLL